jgi:hypothetical protein
MSKHLLRAAMALGLVALAFSFTGTVQAQDTSTSTNAPAATPKPKSKQFTGIVESIDASSAIVKKDAESRTFKIGEKTHYSTADKPKGAAALTDIKVGDKVTVRYAEDDGVLKAHSIAVITGAAK